MTYLTCQGCNEKKPDVKKRRQNTAYADDESNFSICCADCQKDADEYWSEMWSQYYEGCM